MVIILCLCVYVFTKCMENYNGKLCGWNKLLADFKLYKKQNNYRHKPFGYKVMKICITHSYSSANSWTHQNIADPVWRLSTASNNSGSGCYNIELACSKHFCHESHFLYLHLFQVMCSACDSSMLYGYAIWGKVFLFSSRKQRLRYKTCKLIKLLCK